MSICYALSIDRTAPPMDLLLAQALMDRAVLPMDEHRPVLSGFSQNLSNLVLKQLTVSADTT